MAIQVVVLPWLGFGHLMPFFELSLALAKAGVHVSYVSTPKNIQQLPKIPSTLSPLINLVPLPFPADSDAAALLRELGGGESTADLPNEKVPLLMEAYDLLQKPFKQFIAQQSPDWIVIDFIPYWGVNVGQELGIPVVIFSAFSAAAMVFWGPPEYLCGDGRKRVRSSPESMGSPPWWVGFPSSVAYRSHEAFGAHFWFYSAFGSDMSIAERIAKALHGCQAVAVRSCREVEGDYLNSFANFMCNKQVIPVGVLPPQQKNDNTGGAPMIFKWLDQQKPKSVLFVGFGSEGNKLSKDQIYEMAHGIEASEIPFMWALAKPSWATDDDVLPPGFDGRTSQRGRVHIGWVPQNEILSHPSIGGSLFHAGWGSVIENLQFGHCLVVLPFIVDQFLNARLLVEMGLAIEVERRGDGSICREDIAESLKKAMVYKEAEIMREKLRKVAENFQDRKLQDHYIAAFIDYLKNGVALAG